MPTRREALAIGSAASVGLLVGGRRALASADPRLGSTLQTRLFNFKEDTAKDAQSNILRRLKALGEMPGVDSILVGRNFIPDLFPGRFEWIYMIQLGDPAGAEARTSYGAFEEAVKVLSSLCRNAVACDLSSAFPAKFAAAADVKVRHTVMFDFKPDASPEARERNVAAIRNMGKLPMVKRYFVEPTAAPDLGPTQMQWQVIGDFGSVEDYRAYSQAPVHLAIRDDFQAHTARVAFLDVEL